MTEVQKITLRDVLRQKGLHERRIDDIMLLLRFKPERVQMAFYYVTSGMTQSQAAKHIGVSQATINFYLTANCADVRDYLYAPTV